jgi:phosphotransferase system HPr-like phosphotransfer protein
MKTIRICLNSFDKVKDFVNTTCKLDYDIDLISGRYVVNGQSIMGIFSLDLSKPIDMTIVNAKSGEQECPKELEEFMI